MIDILEKSMNAMVCENARKNKQTKNNNNNFWGVKKHISQNVCV